MGLRGITIFESSGDSGLGGTCIAADFVTNQLSVTPHTKGFFMLYRASLY